MIRNLVILIIGLIIGYYIASKGACNLDFSTKRYDTIAHTIDTVYKVHDTTIYKKGKDIHHDTTIYVDVPVEVLRNVDTAAILKEFYAINVFKDTVQLSDSLGWVAVTDSVQKNKILARNWDYNIKSKTIYETTILREVPKGHFYLGISSVGPGVLYVNKKNLAFNLSSNGKIHNFGVYYKIK